MGYVVCKIGIDDGSDGWLSIEWVGRCWTINRWFTICTTLPPSKSKKKMIWNAWRDGRRPMRLRLRLRLGLDARAKRLLR